MKPCTCGGSNDSCRYCSGSGYVADSVVLLKGPESKGNPWIPESYVEKAPRPPVYIKRPTNWNEIIVGVLVLLFPFIIMFLQWLLK